MPRIKDHVHTYVRGRKQFGEVMFKCDDPDCYHASPAWKILGKRTVCAICHNTEFVLSREDLRRARPRCPECSNTQEAQKRRALKQTIEKLIEDVVPKEETLIP